MRFGKFGKNLLVALSMWIPLATLSGVTKIHAGIYLHYWNSDTTVVERETTITVRVLAYSVEQPQSIDYRVVGMTAEAGRDFVAASGTLLFQPGDSEQKISVQLLDDSDVEAQEQFSVELLNPQPTTEISKPIITFKLADDETGYAIGMIPRVAENIGHVDVKIRRHGDFNFESSVEAYIEAQTAIPGKDYIDETFHITFPPRVSERSIRIRLLNDADEDGQRTFAIRLRNGTGGVPTKSEHSIYTVPIYDDEFGYYTFSRPGDAFSPDLYEGGTNRLYLVRPGDYDVASVATVSVRETGLASAAAEAGADFVGEVFQITFAAGQTIAEIPIQIVNDDQPELGEYFLVEHPKSVSDATLITTEVLIIDNEFNPLPVAKVCLDVDPRSGTPFQPSTSIFPVQDGFLLRAFSEPWFEYPFQLIRLQNNGSMDTGFHPIDLDRQSAFTPLQVVETADRKYLVLLDKTIRRYENDGDPDPTFQPYSADLLRSIVELNGRIYAAIGINVVRLNDDGTIDESFTPPDLGLDGYLQTITTGPGDSLYVQGLFTPPQYPVITNYARLNQNGSIDPSFVPTGLEGNIFGRKEHLYIRNIAGRIDRLTAAGEYDLSFHPLELPGFTDDFDFDGNGHFYAQRDSERGLVFERYNADGVLDPTFLRGETDFSFLARTTAVSLDGTTVILIPHEIPAYPFINGIDTLCPLPYLGYSMARLDLMPAPRVVTPPVIWMHERESGAPDLIPFTRTGLNANSTALGRFKTRNGSALKGQHFDFPDQGEVNFAAGVSRVELPVTIYDNSVAENFRNFFIDLVNENGTVLSTSEIRIINDDNGLEIVGIANNRLRLRHIGGDSPLDFDWMVSSDLANWESGYITYNGSEVEIDLSGPQRFIWGAPTSIPYDQAWESSTFSRR
jgi:hypothetical protein